jgi:preprotein translocase subunit SecG
MSHPWTDVFSILFAIASLFLIFIILLQRGRGGGLAGAFGATGGQSAFGTKAGDIFTRITIGIAVVWVALAAGTGFAMRAESQGRFKALATGDDTQLIPATPPAGAGGQTNPFEAGDQGTKTAPATKGATGKDAKTAPATSPPAKSSSSVTPPASTAPASNAKQTPAPSK